MDFAFKECRVVAAAHQLQHFVAAALKRYVEMGHESTRMYTKVNDLIGQQIRLNAGNAIAFDALHTIQGTQQVNKGFARGATKVARVDPRDDNFLASLRRHLLRLLHQRCDGTVARTPPGNGDGAIGAVIVASVLHFKEIARAVAPGARRHECADVIRRHADGFVAGIPTGQRPFLRQTLLDILPDFSLLFHTQHEVHSFKGRNLFCFELCVTAHHHHKGSRVFPCEAVDGLATLVIGHIRYRAGIDNADIGLLPPGSSLHPFAFQQIAQRRGLGKIQFAAQCLIGCFHIL